MHSTSLEKQTKTTTKERNSCDLENEMFVEKAFGNTHRNVKFAFFPTKETRCTVFYLLNKTDKSNSPLSQDITVDATI